MSLAESTVKLKYYLQEDEMPVCSGTGPEVGATEGDGRVVGVLAIPTQT